MSRIESLKVEYIVYVLTQAGYIISNVYTYNGGGRVHNII